MSLKRLIRRLPFVTAIQRKRYARRVRRSGDWGLWGNFRSYAEALASAPVHPSLKVGYDTPELATDAVDEYAKMHLFDYPALHWIRTFAEELGGNGADPLHLVDLGGHLGVKYRTYGAYWPFPPHLTWTVLETPTTVATAEAQGLVRTTLGFTSNRQVLEGADILFASGSVQYLDWPFLETLAGLTQPPRALVINKIGVWDFEDRWTLQNVGAAMVPHAFFDRARFLARCAALGYELVDEWRAWETPMRIPYRAKQVPEAVVVGFSLRRR